MAGNRWRGAVAVLAAVVVMLGGASPVSAAAYPNPGRVTGDTGTHDPAVVRAPDGRYILAATGNNLSLKTSTDRIAWRNAGAVWPGGAPWTTPYTGGGRNLWAPDISYHNGQYYLYYSASTFGSQRSAIFLATSPTAASGSWTHQGLVIESSNAVNYNAIDPNLVADASGQWWLSFGSFWSGIKLIRLDPSTGRRSTSDTSVRSLASRPNAGGAVEAPFIQRRGGYYYLWVSFDRCCQGASSTYRVMVGRSTSVTGPYTDRNGTPSPRAAAPRSSPVTTRSTARGTRRCSPTAAAMCCSTTTTRTAARRSWAST
ncbi:arabinan endo-1,5-alpha-L-arabinosidase [Phytohabitans flavus]|uniref:arabinan endo-1,5-alpha-L-arabinosidase n=1 Tax=Phytohabitans flavus TaxID=1076124 RepID=UPI00363C3BCE